LAGLRVAPLFGAEDGSLFLGSAQKHYPFLLIEVAELFGHHHGLLGPITALRVPCHEHVYHVRISVC